MSSRAPNAAPASARNPSGTPAPTAAFPLAVSAWLSPLPLSRSSTVTLPLGELRVSDVEGERMLGLTEGVGVAVRLVDADSGGDCEAALVGVGLPVGAAVGVPDGDMDGVAPDDSVDVAESVAAAEVEAVAAAEALDDRVAAPDEEPERLMVALREVVADNDAAMDGVPNGDAPIDLEPEGVVVRVAVRLIEADPDKLTETVPVTLADTVRETLTVAVTLAVVEPGALGATVPEAVPEALAARVLEALAVATKVPEALAAPEPDGLVAATVALALLAAVALSEADPDSEPPTSAPTLPLLTAVRTGLRLPLAPVEGDELRVGVTGRPGTNNVEMSGHSWSPSVRLPAALPDVVASTAHMPPGPSERSMYG